MADQTVELTLFGARRAFRASFSARQWVCTLPGSQHIWLNELGDGWALSGLGFQATGETLERVARAWEGAALPLACALNPAAARAVDALSRAARKVPIVRRSLDGQPPASTCLGCGQTDSDPCLPECWVSGLEDALAGVEEVRCG